MGKRKKKNKIEKIDFKLSEVHFNQLILYVSTYNDDYITPSKLSVVQEFYEMINESLFEDDEELYSRYKLLGSLIDGRVNKKIRDYNKLYMYASDGGFKEAEVEKIHDEIVDYAEGDDELVDEEDIEFVYNMVQDFIQYGFIFKESERINTLTLKLEQQDFDSLSQVCDDFYKCLSDLYNKFTNVKNTTNDNFYDFNSNDDSLNNVVEKTIKDNNKSSHKLKTSIRMKNKLLNGGYEGGRFYLYIGLPGGWKSGELLNICLDIKHFNNLKAEDFGGKEPTVLYVTQENSIRETVERIWSHYMGDEDDISKYTTDEALKILKQNGFQEGANLAIKYRPSKSISTQHLKDMIDDIERNGGKVVCLVQDYMKRIRSTENNPNLYEELGNVSDEMCNIAKQYDIPVISATQFNRNGLKVIEEALKKSKSDPLKEIGTSDIGESVKLVDNSDVIISIHKKPNPQTGEIEISYNKLKQRGKRSKDDLTYFSHPFEENNGMKLKPDLNLAKSLSKLESGNGLEQFNAKEHRKNKNSKKEKQSEGTKKTTTKQKSGGRMFNNKKLVLDDDDEE